MCVQRKNRASSRGRSKSRLQTAGFIRLRRRAVSTQIFAWPNWSSNGFTVTGTVTASFHADLCVAQLKLVEQPFQVRGFLCVAQLKLCGRRLVRNKPTGFHADHAWPELLLPSGFCLYLAKEFWLSGCTLFANSLLTAMKEMFSNKFSLLALSFSYIFLLTA